MGGNYERGLYNQLMEVMERLDTVEKESKKEIKKLNDEISGLKKENQHLKEENRLLRDDNARMKSILNNDSSNTSQPPSTDQKGGKPANTYNSRDASTRSGRLATLRENLMLQSTSWILISNLSSQKYVSMRTGRDTMPFPGNTIVMWSMVPV